MEQAVLQSLSKVIGDIINEKEIEMLLEKPKHDDHLGDLAFPCFSLAKQLRKPPHVIAKEIVKEMETHLFAKVETAGAYINIFYDRVAVTKSVISRILKEGSSYGSKKNTNEKIVVDYSSPNIAKPFSMGQLRSTVIGNAVANIAEKNGYEVIRINHLGDWGTLFGKLLVAYRLWEDQAAIDTSPIQELLRIYVKFHEEAEKNEKLNDLAREAFKALEDGEHETGTLWKWFREALLKEFGAIYDVLGIHFDAYVGEAYLC
ncbi:MAG TPA: arginine--tRNA ligase [Bacillota bacterium]|nr:arginine--tRNA ligase [Bacillota bacterium]